MPIAMRSARANASSASFTSGMIVTVLPSKLGSFASLFLLCGAKYRVATDSHKSRTSANVSSQCSATFPGSRAVAVLTAGALWFAASDATVRITAAAWTTFNVLHLWYHVSTLQMYDGCVERLVGTSLAIL